MNTRRDFLAFTAGAVAARTVIPAIGPAKAGPVDLGDNGQRFLALFRRLNLPAQEAALRYMQRRLASEAATAMGDVPG